MDSKFIPATIEKDIYNFWEKNGYLHAEKGTPYTILMPPPNANASLHAGHGMYTVDDIVIRYKRLRGYASLWIPGTDHAGIETQYVYEKQLAKEGKSRLDFDRKTLYDNIYKFVKENSGLIFHQFKRLGFLADWNRSVYTLDKHVLQRVFETFQKMHEEKYVYRDSYMVNYCVYCGTTLAELEINHEERKDPLYYIKFFFTDKETFQNKNYIVVATVRPETIFVDKYLAVNPKDKKRNSLVGRKVRNPLTGAEMEIIVDEYADPKFGTGIVKLTPAHDPNDFEVAKRHNMKINDEDRIIDWNGRITNKGGTYEGMKVKAARSKVAADLDEKGFIEKVDENYLHAISICYKCKRDLEPMIIPNWFIRVQKLKEPAMEAIKNDRIKFHPKKFKKQILQWLAIMHDWPISRQNVWGIRIPVWYKVDPSAANIWVWWIDKNKQLHQNNLSYFLKEGVTLAEIKAGLQKVYALSGESQPEYKVSIDEPVDGDYIPETDTFDTWFSSGQWPLVTLKENEYSTRFPTDMMGTLADILKFWVSRMIMFSLYLRQEIPFKDVYLWSMVADSKGVKMSKSKGNVINPLDLVDKYGADAFRASLIFGTAQGGKVNLAENKVVGMRNFTNKVWNIGRFIWLNKTQPPVESSSKSLKMPLIKQLEKELKEEKKKYLKYMEGYKFSQATELVYSFLWHRFADYYIEELKDDLRNGNIEVLAVMEKVYVENLQMLHPFMPFVTEAVWQEFYGKDNSILNKLLS